MRIPAWLIPLLLRFLPERILGFSTRLILSNAPEIIAAGKVVAGVVNKLKEKGASEAQAERAAAEMIANRRVMTFEEEQAWMNRASGAGEF